MSEQKTENRYELNKQLAQMLKGGVIMDVPLLSRQGLPRRQVPALSWRWRGFRLISAPQAAYPA